MQKGFITPAVALILGTLLIGAPLVAWYTAEPDTQVAEEQSFGGFNDPFISYQLATTTLTNGNVLQTDGTNSFWVSTSSLGIVGGGGSGLTSLNSQTGSSQTFATGTATGIGLTITSGSDIHTFTPTVLSGYAIPLTASTTEWATAFANNHVAVTLAGEDFLSLSTQQITANPINEDNLNLNAPTDNYLLVASSTASGGFEWVATSTARLGLGTGGGSGTVTSVDMSVPTGLAIAGNPITTSGTLALTLDTGYVIPLSASTTNWNTFYDTPSNRITAGTNLTWSGNTLNVDDPFNVTDLTATNATTTLLYVDGASTFNATSTWAAGIHPIMHGIYAADSSGLHLHSNNGTEVAFFGAGGGANITFPNYTSALLQTGVSGALAEYAGTACTNQFVRSLSALAAATCAAVNLTSDVTGTLPIANGGTGTSTAPALGQLLLGNASGSYDLVATSSLGITASAGGANTQLQYNSGGALAGLSTLTTDGSSLTMTGTSTLATTTITNLNAGGSSLVVTPGNATFGGDVFGAGMCDGTGANCFTLNSGFINFGIGAGDYVQFNGSENDADTYFSTDNGTYTLFVDGGTDRVGIGTSTPSSLLTVAGAIEVTGTSTLRNLALPENAYIAFGSPANAFIRHSADTITLDADNIIFNADLQIGSSVALVDNPAGTLTLWNVDALGGATEATIEAAIDTIPGTLTVVGTSTLASTTATRLGVGTTTIAGGTQILTVDGSALFTGETTLGQNLYVTDNIGMTTNNAYIEWGDGSTLIGGNSSTDVLSFYTAGTENLTVYSNGNVGIGTTTPGVKLTVIGGIWANATSTFATTTITNLLGMTSIDSTSITTIENAFDTVSAALETAIEAALDTLTNLTNVAVSTVLQIPNGTGPTANDPGEIAHDTSDNQLILDDYVVGKATDTIFKVTVASTSPAFTNSGLLKVPTELDGFTITAIRCSVETGTSKVVAIEDASGNSSEDITCGTTVTSDDGSITNASYTAGEELYIDFGATSGSVDYVSISVFGTWVRE